MQVLPLLTPTYFTYNDKKRGRPEDDFESNCLKKRLISSTWSPTTPSYEDSSSNDEDNDDYDYAIDNEDITRGIITPPPVSKNQAYIDDNKNLQETTFNNSKKKAILNKNDNYLFELNDNIFKHHNTKKQHNYIPRFALNKELSILHDQDESHQQQLILYRPNPLLNTPVSPPTTPRITEILDDEDDVEDNYEPMDID